MLICTLNITNLIGDDLDGDFEYFTHLITRNIISLNEIYDMKSQKFIKALHDTKIRINIENYDEFINLHKFDHVLDMNDIYDVMRPLSSNFILNDKIYASADYENFKKTKNIKDFTRIKMSIKCGDKGSHPDFKHIDIYKINKKYYCYEFLRKYTPCIIRWDINHNFYILNRDYEYIGLNCEHIDYDKKDQCYVCNNAIQWTSKESYISMRDNFKKIKKDNALKVCINHYSNLNVILTLLD
jgi:hypothetical protein